MRCQLRISVFMIPGRRWRRVRVYGGVSRYRARGIFIVSVFANPVLPNFNLRSLSNLRIQAS